MLFDLYDLKLIRLLRVSLYINKKYISFSDYYENNNYHIIKATFMNEHIYTLNNVYNMYVKEKVY